MKYLLCDGTLSGVQANAVLFPDMEDGYLSIELSCSPFPWQSTVEFARAAHAALGCEVRCDPGELEGHGRLAPSEWWSVDTGREGLVTWEPGEAQGDARQGGMSQESDLAKFTRLAEEAYGRMYDSNYPKDDRDDALYYLGMAIDLAQALNLKEQEAALRARYEHISAVFNSQFRM